MLNSNLTLYFHVCLNPHVKPDILMPARPDQCARPDQRFFNTKSVEENSPCYQHLLAVQLLLVYMDSSIFCQLSVGGWSQATYQILIDVQHVHSRLACVNRRINSRQRTCHQPTSRRSSWSSSTRRRP